MFRIPTLWLFSEPLSVSGTANRYSISWQVQDTCAGVWQLNPAQTSISTCFSYDRSLEDLLPLIAAARFTHVSLGAKAPHSSYLSVSKRGSLRGLLDESDLRMDTIHGTRLDQHDSISNLTTAAEAAAFLNVPVVVVHASSFNFDSSEFDKRLEVVLKNCETLLPVAEDTGVRFALENVLPGPATDLVSSALDRLPREHFGFCYDSSHDQIGGPKPFDLLDGLADRLLALHLSDRIREHVDHVIPGEGFIAWPVLCGKIRRSAYAGPISLEVLTDYSKFKDQVGFLRQAYRQAERLYQLVFGQNAE